MKKLIAISLFLATASSHAQLITNIFTEGNPEPLESTFSNFTFNYSIRYLGPSLSGNHQEGATFNRFRTGKNAL